MILISACLIGINCRYDGKSSLNMEFKKLVEEGKAIVACPEVLGGLDTPREPCEIKKIDNKIVIATKEGKDCTEEFLLGAMKTLKIAKENKCEIAIMKSKSPSCGCGKVYNGNFNKTLIEGDGITVSLLKENGIKIFNELNYFNQSK